MPKLFIILSAISFISSESKSQGCVAIRNVAGFGEFAALGYKETTDKWMMNINNRYFHATQAFRGKDNVTPPDPNNGLSIYEYTMNLELSRILSKGWELAIDLPISSNTIVSKAEHASGVRHSTSDFGIGDFVSPLINGCSIRKRHVRGIFSLAWVLNFRPVIITPWTISIIAKLILRLKCSHR